MLNENFRESDAIFILEKNRTVGPKYYRWNLGKWNEKTKFLYEIENFFWKIILRGKRFFFFFFFDGKGKRFLFSEVTF